MHAACCRESSYLKQDIAAFAAIVTASAAEQCSIRVPQARDDPIAPIEAVPFEELKRNEHCILAVTPRGGDQVFWISSVAAILQWLLTVPHEAGTS